MENDRERHLGISICTETIRIRLNETGLKFTSASPKICPDKFRSNTEIKICEVKQD